MQPQNPTPQTQSQETSTTPQVVDTTPSAVSPPVTIVSMNSQADTNKKAPLLIIAIVCTVILVAIIAGVAVLLFRSDDSKSNSAPKTNTSSNKTDEVKTPQTEAVTQPQAVTYPADIRQKFIATCLSGTSSTQEGCTCELNYFEQSGVPVETAVNYIDSSTKSIPSAQSNDSITYLQEETMNAMARSSRACY